jgi:cyclopropane-fatty-acyl-phospholipid synthase
MQLAGKLHFGGRRTSGARAVVENLLEEADVRVDGRRPWDIRVRDERFFDRLVVEQSLGAGESYMDGWWDCERLDEMICRIMAVGFKPKLRPLPVLVHYLMSRLINLQSGDHTWDVGRRHYDIGDDLYQRMLDRRMIYSCGFWAGARDLDHAQEQKLELIFAKLQLAPGTRVLDIGCGWGGAARFAAKRYGVEVVGITVSEKQVERARRVCEGLPVKILLCDYRDLAGHLDAHFDRVYSIGMVEHVGYRNYKRYLEIVRQCLKDDGLFLLHSIGGNTPVTVTDPWIERYIFPNSMLPSASQLTTAYEPLFVMEDWQNFGVDYDRTLMCWHQNVNGRWDEIADRYDTRFRRMWNYYLLTTAGAFRSRQNQLWQIVLSPKGLRRGYSRYRRERFRS